MKANLMISDSFFEIGTTHEVCEDYAISGNNYAVVSDGCSNSGHRIDTDWGSRILCKSAQAHIEEFDSDEFVKKVLQTSKESLVSIPSLIQESLTATLLTLRVVENCFQIISIGDGVIGAKNKNGDWTIHVIEYPKGPYYLNYKILNKEQEFQDSFGTSFKINTYIGNIKDSIPDLIMFEERKNYWSQKIQFTQQDFNIDFSAPFQMFNFPIEEYEFAFVCSDGMDSFYQNQNTSTSKHTEKVHVLDVFNVVMDFLNFNNSFARVQRNWAFRQNKPGTLIRRNWKNFDDVSVGVIHA